MPTSQSNTVRVFHADPVTDYLKEIGRVDLLTAQQEVDLSKRIEAGLFAEHKLDTQSLPADFRADLALIAEDGRRAKDHLIEANLRLVVQIAKRYLRTGVELLDLVQEGNIGLIRAVEKFDYTKGYKFSTYGTWWIRQAIQRGLIDLGRLVRLPNHMVERLAKLNRLTRDWVQAHDGRMPTAEDLAPDMGIEPEQVEFLFALNRHPISLDDTVGEEDTLTVGDLIEDTDVIDTPDLVCHWMLADLIKSVFDTLTDRESMIMAMRFGFYDGHPHTLDEIGKEFGLTRERIRQIESTTLDKLRHPSRSQVLLAYAS